MEDMGITIPTMAIPMETVPIMVHTINPIRLDQDTTITVRAVMAIITITIAVRVMVAAPVSREPAVLAAFSRCV
jgi:hypothetical protein